MDQLGGNPIEDLKHLLLVDEFVFLVPGPGCVLLCLLDLSVLLPQSVVLLALRLLLFVALALDWQTGLVLLVVVLILRKIRGSRLTYEFQP